MEAVLLKKLAARHAIIQNSLNLNRHASLQIESAISNNRYAIAGAKRSFTRLLAGFATVRGATVGGKSLATPDTSFISRMTEALFKSEIKTKSTNEELSTKKHTLTHERLQLTLLEEKVSSISEKLTSRREARSEEKITEELSALRYVNDRRSTFSHNLPLIPPPQPLVEPTNALTKKESRQKESNETIAVLGSERGKSLTLRVTIEGYRFTVRLRKDQVSDGTVVTILPVKKEAYPFARRAGASVENHLKNRPVGKITIVVM